MKRIMCKTSYSVDADKEKAQELLSLALSSNDSKSVWELADFLHDSNLLQKVATESSVSESTYAGRARGISDAMSAFADVMKENGMYSKELVDQFRSALLAEVPNRVRELYLEDRGKVSL